MITLLSFLPILSLLICLLVLKFPANKSGAVALIVAIGVCLITFKPGVIGLSISMAKGFGLALFVIFIIWGAMLLYNIVKEVGALKVINNNISIIVEDHFLQFILLSWIFASFLQGIAGFGVPVIVVTPILIGMGFDPIMSAAAVLVGHSWSISFGSMGSSISAIDLVTDTELHNILLNMALFGTIAMVVTGIAVCAIYNGKKEIVKGMPYILCISATMGFTLFVLALLDMTSLMGLLAGLVGMITLLVIYKIKNKEKESKPLYKDKINLFEAVLPYVLIVCFSILFFILDPQWKIELDFPGFSSLTGQVVAAEEGYITFNVLKYPFSIIMLSSLFSGVIYWKKKVLNGETLKKIMNATVKKCTSTTITLVFLLAMAQIMMDSGMINNLANFLVNTTKGLYPFIAPLIGLLGSFVTGSNTNSNVLFGNLQETAASALGVSTALMCAVQSIGASIGGGIGPTTVALGATAAQVVGQESQIYKKTLWPILIGAAILGVVNMVIVYCFN